MTQLIGDLPEEAYLSEVIGRIGHIEELSAKMALTVNLEGKSATKVSGTLRMRKDEAIQISVAPLLGIEVGRIEMTPDRLLAIDRLNKRYVEVSFGELKEMTHADLDFYTLQALFFNELFLPSKKEVTSRDVARFELSLENHDRAQIVVKQSRMFTYDFFTSVADGKLLETRIGLKNTPYRLLWGYDQFVSLENQPYPSHMRIAFEGGKKPVVAEFAFSRFSTEGGWKGVTEIPKRYEKVELKVLLKSLFD
ncbi:MAG: DUF4292 domain-containing protein [Phocaeicola sp.]